MTGNLGRNQAQAQQPILRGDKTKVKTYSGWCQPRMIAHMQSQA